MTPTPSIAYSSTRSLRITCADAHSTLSATHALRSAQLPWIIDAWHSILVLAVELDPHAAPPNAINTIRDLIASAAHIAPPPPRTITIPVCYATESPDFGPDLHSIAELNHLSLQDVIRIHASTTYSAHFLGFSPGFAYLGQVPAQIRAPRLASPRTRIEPGSVAIAADMTAIYPSPTPGGWRILGRTPLRIFDPHRSPPSLISPGDHINFTPISRAEFDNLAVHITPSPAPNHHARPPALRVIHPGHFTTIQDLGRPGHASLGVARSGAFDPIAHTHANALVGNAPTAAALEITLSGPTLEALEPLTIAVTGADVACTITRPSGQIAEFPTHRPVSILPGEKLRIAHVRSGVRCTLAIQGGIDVPLTLGSRSTHVSSALGGHLGRPLRTGDELTIGTASAYSPAQIASPAHHTSPHTLTITPGPHTDTIAPDAFARFCATMFTVSPTSDRHGVRLSPASPLPTTTATLPTEPTLPGFIQLAPSNEAIILGPDGPTTGGYPIIAAITHTDLPTLAHLRPGDTVRFQPAPLPNTLL